MALSVPNSSWSIAKHFNKRSLVHVQIVLYKVVKHLLFRTDIFIVQGSMFSFKLNILVKEIGSNKDYYH